MRSAALAVLGCVVFFGCSHKNGGKKTPYSIVRIELAIMDALMENGQKVDYDAAMARLYHAGPAAVPELAVALESPHKLHREFAGDALWKMTSVWKWPEAYTFLIERASPEHWYVEQVGELLYAAAHEGIKDYPDILLMAAFYLHEETYVVRTVRINSPTNRHEMRVCDYAAYVIQIVSGSDFGAGRYTRSDDAVAKADAWVLENMTQWKDGKETLVIPDTIKKKARGR